MFKSWLRSLCLILVLAPPIFANDGIDPSFSDLPLLFIENKGQVEEEVDYYLQGSDKTLYFTSKGVTIALPGWAVRLDFSGANSSVNPRAEDKQATVVSYFRGPREDWKRNIPTFRRLVYPDLWPGIDLVYSGTAKRLKYEFVVQPGGDPGKIRLAYSGVSDVTVARTGALEVATPAGGFTDEKPYAYQVVEGKQREVSMNYALKGRRPDGAFAFGFDVGSFDADLPLVLDPAMLVYCGFIGGDSEDGYFSVDVAVDGQGNAYVTGDTTSDELSFPVSTGPDLGYNGNQDVFVAKVKADGTGLEYCGYIGGSMNEYGLCVAVDPGGNAYVTGWTASDETSFPVKTGPDLVYNGGWYDVFVAKVMADGSDLEYCGYIGGAAEDYGYGVAVDGQGSAYVTGRTVSKENTFPEKIGPDLTHNGGFSDAFVAKVMADGSGLEYCGFVGGGSFETAFDLALDTDNNVYLAGQTGSDETTFPVKTGPDLTFNDTVGVGTDAFTAKVMADGSDLEYCGYIGGAAEDMGFGVAVDAKGCACVTGWTLSDETSFPVKAGPDLTHNGGDRDAFAAKVKADGSTFDYCGYIGGGGEDFGFDVDMDGSGNAYVTGKTDSSGYNGFPVKLGPELSISSLNDAFVARINTDGSTFDYCGYIGGGGEDLGHGIAVDPDGNAYVAGTTDSDEYTFPVKKGPDFLYNGGFSDVFVSKVMRPSLRMDVAEISATTGGVVNFTLDAQAENGSRDYLILGSVTGTEPGFPLPGGTATMPLNFDALTLLTILMANTGPLQNFMGTLDGQGAGAAQLIFPAEPSAAWITLYFAYLLNAPFDFTSNPVALPVVP